MSVRVDVLGPLRLTVDGQEVDVPGPRRRALLALLTLAEGRAVPADDLIDALWPDDAPESARATLQSHVSRLRRHLGTAAERLEGRAGSYRLALGSEGTDLAAARALYATARRAADAGSPLDEARALWRGEPLAEFGDVTRLAAAATSIGELRRSIDQAYVKALLDGGDTDRAVAAATDLVATDPLSEPALLLLMRSLHAAGRSAEALRAAYEHRRQLVSETGLDPSPAVAELEAELAATATRPKGAVPRPSHPLRGRDSELASLRRLLATERLVTVLGPGGVGKTHLALEAAAAFEPATAVLLAPVTDEGALAQTIAESLDLRVLHGEPLTACAAVLAAGPRLLVLDNCEHLLPAVRHATQLLLDTCPGLTVLATSREPLGVAAEQRLRLAPLPLTRAEDPEGVARAPSVAVFLDRVRRLGVGLVPGPAELATISQIVRRLDGMPLAIELAAARLSTLGLQDLHDRVDQALDLCDTPSGTLRQTIAWSYDLLRPDEQRLLRHLGAFVDGIELGDAEALAADLMPQSTPLPLLARLVDASMLEVSTAPTTRYRMLDTVRAFTGEQLELHDEAGAATERFLQWALRLVRWVDDTLNTLDEHRVDAVLRRERANLRAAWAAVRALGRVDDAIRIVLGLIDAASWRDLTEVGDWSLELADDPALRQHPDAPAVLGAAASSAWFRGGLDRAQALAEAGLELAGIRHWSCVDAQSLVALSRGELAACADLAVQAADDAARPVPSLGIAALARGYAGELDRASTLNARFRAVATSPTLQAFHAYVTAEISALAGDRAGAASAYETAIALARSVGSTFVEGIASVGRLSHLATEGRTVEALAGYRDLIDYWERTGAWVQQWTTLRNLADLLDSIDHPEPALFLRHAADCAPDSPTPAVDQQSPPHLGSEIVQRLRGEAASAGREAVLRAAREAILRALV